jgi:hypothetical protein
MTDIGGSVEPGFEGVADAFRANFDEHGDVGAATAIYVGGKMHEVIMDFEQTKEAADGRKDKKTETDPLTGISYQKFGHITDLSDYLLCYAFNGEYMKYQKGGRKATITIGPVVDNKY